MAIKICLDAGHYGKYNRSNVVKSYYESIMNWKLHNYLATELKSYGFTVTKTRSNQAKDLALSSRGKKSKGCDLFLSIHSNACDTERVDRPVGIYLVDDNCSGIDEQSKAVAKLLAETVRDVMQTNDPAKIYSKLSSRDRDGDGKKNDDYYGVLHAAHQVGTAGVILEHSFHTNTRAAKWLLEDANLQTLAKAEAKALADYYNQEKQEPVQEVKVDYAADKDLALKGKYVVKSSDGFLNLRAGASTSKAVIEAMPTGSTVRCYGWHTGDWLYVVSAAGNKGFCSKAYLVKQ